MGNIIGTGFNAGSTDGELASLEQELRVLADMGVDTVELALTSLDLIAGDVLSRNAPNGSSL
ncbi:hypothetical protein RRU01S_07_06080 [Agrobacterium rubi TR3 = NBRC 13261]|uniref:Uncharacterized protein n=1 Tax=Agrobacterium rubi TR3 = NBRC 13261 TaxID=1368415 RepID=A0A081CTT3_9HYPH|nr:hypothetical protein RRU01S_07_06080 [Agrobacterium rubi TR3 = NBRC 13261]